MKYCAKHEIRMRVTKLGRLPKDKALYVQHYRDERSEAGERNKVESKFGTDKRCYRLDQLTALLKDTSETQIHMILRAINLRKKMRSSFEQFFK